MLSSDFKTDTSGGPGWNRTTTYGFGDHRPIHWTTGPFQCEEQGCIHERPLLQGIPWLEQG